MSFRQIGLACGMVALATTSLVADGISLPTSSANWLNSAPISAEALRGKAAVLWFFEEQ